MKGSHFYSDASVEELYSWFADETVGSSAVWERLCRWIADDAAAAPLRDRLDALPGTKRQPNLFLGALKMLGGPLDPGPAHLGWVAEHWPRIERIVLDRGTQTNEAGRCATLVPTLVTLGERLALIEVGMSAGLCLFPDRYAYRWTTKDGGVHELAPRLGRERPRSEGVRGGERPRSEGVRGGERPRSEGVRGGERPHVQRSPSERQRDEELVLDCAVSGPVTLPRHLPEVVWRAGIDLNPLDPADRDDAAWLEALVWPGQDERQRRLHAALGIAAGQPVERVRGDALVELPALVERAPADATVVVFHSAVLAYLGREDRHRFAELVTSLGVRWVANEGESVVPGVRDRLRPWEGAPGFVLSLDGAPVARTGAHGQYLHAPA